MNWAGAHVLALVAATAALLAIAGCTSASPSPSPSSPPLVSEIAPVDAALTQTFDCADPIGTGATLADVAQDPIATDVMAITGGAPGSELDPIQLSDNTDSNGFSYAKIGIAIKTGAKFSIVVPPAWQDRMRIGWSNKGPVLATTLQVPGCTSAIPGTEWVVYPGGFRVKTAACVPLTIETDTGIRNIQVPVGKRCP
jgi:hypothetical protein